MNEQHSKILLVGVPQRIRELFESQRTNYFIQIAESVEIASALVEHENIKLCVLSDTLPDMERFIGEVRSNPLASELPLLVITSKRTHEELFKLGADAFFGTSESDAKFLEKIELLMGLSDSNRSGVFHKRTENENPFYFAMQYAAGLVSGKENITPLDHDRLLPESQSLQSLIQDIEKVIQSQSSDQTAIEIPEGLESVDPQGYIDQQLSVGERIDMHRRDLDTPRGGIKVTKKAPSAPSTTPRYLVRPEVSGSASTMESFSETADTYVLRRGEVKAAGQQSNVSNRHGDTLSQPFSVKKFDANNDKGIRQAFVPAVNRIRKNSKNQKNLQQHISDQETISQFDRSFAQETDEEWSVSRLSSPEHGSVSISRGDVAENEPIEHTVELPIAGIVKDKPFWWVVSVAMESRFSGVISVLRNRVERQFYFDRGELMVVNSNAREDRLVELLFREGRISETQYRSASSTVAASGRRAGVIMVEKGIISSRELFPVVRYHYETMFYDTLKWMDGEWKALFAPYDLKERIVLDVPVHFLILEAFRSVVPSEYVETIVDTSMIFHRGNVSEDFLNSLPLTPLEKEFVEWCDGRKSLSWLAAHLDIDPAELRSLAAGLVVLKIIQSVAGTGDSVYSVSAPSRLAVSDAEAMAVAVDSSMAAPLQDTLSPQIIFADASFLEDKLAQVYSGSYFEIAEVSPEASPFEIKQSLQRLKNIYSPERFRSKGETELMEKINIIEEILLETEEVLMNDKIREQYRKAFLEMHSIE